MSQEPAGSVSGSVVDAQSQAPFPGVLVIVQGVGQANTDANGRFTILNVRPGKHNIQAMRSGMARPMREGGPRTIVVAPGEEVRNVRLQLAPYGAIRGRVTDDEGKPLTGTLVEAFVVSYQRGRRTLIPPMPLGTSNNSTVTDEDGEYKLELPPGSYFVSAQYRQASPSLVAFATIPGGSPRTYYPGTPDSGLAATVQLSGGESSGIDIKIPMTRPSRYKAIVRIGGMTSDQGNWPAAGSQIAELYDRITMERMPIIAPLRRGTRPADLVVIDGIPNGSYELYMDGVTEDGRRGRGVTSIDIRGEDVIDAVLTLRPARDIPGRVVAADSSKAFSPSSLIVLLGTRHGNVSADGSFVIPGILEGLYPVTVEGVPTDAYIADIRYGGNSLYETAQNINGPQLQAGLASTPLQIVVAANGGTVGGVVEGRDAAGATVVLVPAPSRRFVPSYYKSTVASMSGAFSLRGVPPGAYQLFAWESVPDTAWLNPEFMSRWEGRGQVITAEAGSTVPVRARIIPAED